MKTAWCTIIGILLTVSSWAQIPGFTIDGQVEGLQDGEKVELQCIKRYTFDYTVNDSAVVKNGRFLVKGTVTDGPREYLVIFKNAKKDFWLWLNNGDRITLRCPDVRKIKHSSLDKDIRLDGDVSTTAFNEFSGSAIFYNHALLDLNRTIMKVKDSLGFDPLVMEGLFTARNALHASIAKHLLWVLESIRDSSAAQIVPRIIQLSEGNFKNEHVPELKKLYYNIPPDVRKSYYMRFLKEQIPLLVGEPFPVFTMATTEGKTVSLKDTIARSKITLVHIWAANSSSREEFQQEVRMLYDKYHSKGLSVVGISSDDSSTEYSYRKTLQQEKFPWSNVCDLKGVEGIVNTVYHEYTQGGFEHIVKVHNTTNVLIDQQGRIISWDVYGPELQYYIWKYTEANGAK